MGPEPDPLSATATAMGTFDALAAWYYDRREARVVVLRDGRSNEPGLDAEAVEKDEQRFVEIPAVTRAEEHVWLEEFQDAHGADWPHIRLDLRKGSGERFLKALTKNRPEVLTIWEAFRGERLLELAREWIGLLPPTA